MEYTQWVKVICVYVRAACLNPCCNGIYSMRQNMCSAKYRQVVLILVVMEYTQWVLPEEDVSEIFMS